MDDKQAMGIIQEVAEIGTQAIRKEKWLKKNWRFVAICLTILLCVAMVCGTVWGVTCHFATLDTIQKNANASIYAFEKSTCEAIDALKEIAYATEVVTETSTVEQDTGEGGDNYYQAGDNNSIGGE